MENKTTTIQISQENWKRLTSLKRESKETHDGTLNRIFKMIRHYKLRKELEAMQ